MTVASTTNRKTFAGDNATTSFGTSPVVFFETSNLEVRVTVNATGVSTLLVENTNYTVTGGVGTTGTVNLAGGSSPWGVLVTGTTLVILRVLPFVQQTDFVQNDGSDAEVAEETVDRIVMLEQQLKEVTDRSVRFPSGDVSGSASTVPAVSSRLNKLLGFDATGLLTVTVPPTGTAAALQTDLADTSSAILGDALVGVKRAETGALATTQHQVNANRFLDVKSDFGAIGDGVADDTAAFNAAFATASPVRVPAGTYKLTGDITRSSGSLILTGDGINATVLRFTANGGLVFNGGAVASSYAANKLVISSLTIETTVANTKAAIAGSWTGGSGTPIKTAAFRDVEIKSTGNGLQFAKGIALDNSRNVTFDNVIVSGHGKASGTYGMAVGVDIFGNSDPVEFWFNNCYIYWTDIGIQATTGTEGLYINDSSLSFNETCVKWQPTGVEPVFHMVGSYCNGSGTLVDLKNISYINIVGSDFSSDLNNETADFYGIRIRQDSDFVGFISIVNCTFPCTGYVSHTEYGISLERANQAGIVECRFYNADVGININSLCNGVRVREPIFVSCTENVIDASYKADLAPSKADYNALTNGGFDVWQRGTSFASAGSGIYTADRWSFFRGGFATGATLSRQTAASPVVSRYATRLQRDSANSSTASLALNHALETQNSIPLRAGTNGLMLSFKVRVGANYSGGDLTANILSGTGTDQPLLGAGFTGQATAGTRSVPVTTSWTRAFVAGGVSTSITQIGIEFSWIPAGTAGANDWLEIADVKLENGYLPSWFESRPFEEELDLCQRYYEKSFPLATAPATNAGLAGATGYTQCVGASTVQNSHGVLYKTRKRIDNTPTIYNPSAANNQVRNQATGTDCSSTSLDSNLTDEDGFAVNTTTPSASAAGNSLVFHWSASAEL